MKIQDIINRLKDTIGFINEQFDEYELEGSATYMLEGIEEAIKLIQDLGSK